MRGRCRDGKGTLVVSVLNKKLLSPIYLDYSDETRLEHRHDAPM